ncbi:MAG TPA: tetratricopeptide repeat protein [Chloroflexota bacterium]|nr:tetratricopeptide repeat protein [Chloroflexota bacterium]
MAGKRIATRAQGQAPGAGGRPPAAGAIPGGEPGYLTLIGERTAATVGVPLPAQPAPLIGRSDELQAARRCVLAGETRLLTFVGPGGAGKTRLAVEVAASLAAELELETVFVDLAPVVEPPLVAAAVAHAAGVRETTSERLDVRLKRALQGRRLLLLLDNFEHLLASPAAPPANAPDSLPHAAGLVAELLAACPELTVLATSRIPLQLRWEQVFVVPPLALPALAPLPPPDHLAAVPAVALFLNRARAVTPDFVLDERNAAAVARVCVRLDGLPLAIQLAASRSRMFSPTEMLARLERGLDVLGGGARDLPARQQTLRAAMAWSYDLLTPAERTVFRRLGVCAGGWTLEAAETIAVGPPETPDGPPDDSSEHTTDVVADGGRPDVVAAVEALLMHSLVGRKEAPDGVARFVMLETIREHALERLDAAGESRVVRGRHAAYYLALAERAAREVSGPREGRHLDGVAREHDNLRAALGWLVGETAVEPALRLAAALWPFWEARGHWPEGRERLATVLALAERAGDSGVRAEALFGAALLARRQGDYAAARALFERCLDRRRDLGDRRGVARTLCAIGAVVRQQGDRGTARTLFEESLAAARDVGDGPATGEALNELGIVAAERGDYPAARRLLEESLDIRREAGDRRGAANCLLNLGNVRRFQRDPAGAAASYEESLGLFRELDSKLGLSMAAIGLGNLALEEGDHAAAQARFEESLAMRRAVGDPDGQARALVNLGRVAVARGDAGEAGRLYAESLRLRHRLGDKAGTASSIEGLAGVAAAAGAHERALLMGGAAEALRLMAGVTLSPSERSTQAAWQRAARRAVGERHATAAWSQGAAMTEHDAVAYALEWSPPGTGEGRGSEPTSADHKGRGATPPIAPPEPGGGIRLTAREREVAALVAQGCTNRQIAERLFVTTGTAALHVEHIRKKLGFHSRAQIAQWVALQGRRQV